MEENNLHRSYAENMQKVTKKRVIKECQWF